MNPLVFLHRRTLPAVLTVIFLALLPLTGCSQSGDGEAPPAGTDSTKPAPVATDLHGERGHIDLTAFTGTPPIKIVATTGMVADIARNVGGTHVVVRALMGPGTDPHLYKATPGDVGALREADLILYSGLHLEGKMADVLVRLARRQPTFAVTDGIPEDRLKNWADTPDAHDPHVWFDAKLWAQAAAFVRDILVQLDPPRAADYTTNAAAYIARLEALDAWAREQLATIPPERRVLITAHDAFGYFGAAYGIEVLGIQGISTESEAGVQRINELVQLIADRGVKAVFVETTVSDKNMQALVEGSRARGHDIRIGGSLYSDAMGDEGGPAGTYEGMFRTNVETIVHALK